jgi:hypothetical protein
MIINAAKTQIHHLIPGVGEIDFGAQQVCPESQV